MPDEIEGAELRLQRTRRELEEAKRALQLQLELFESESQAELELEKAQQTLEAARMDVQRAMQECEAADFELSRILKAAPVDSAAKDQDSNSAAIFGAGIAGLTAAHELAERGFKVTVYEPTTDERPAGAFGKPVNPFKVKLGGMAASQWAKTSGGFKFHQFGASKAPSRDGTELSPENLPGEHGFRFFPAYYLHIWDMMQRIPLYEPGGSATGSGYQPTEHTVYDNVERVITQGVTTKEGRPNLIFSAAAPHSLGEMITSLLQLDTLDFTAGDLHSFTWRLARYLSTSRLRRAVEIEYMSAYDYLVDRDPATGEPRIRYSPAVDKQLRYMPKVLAAFDAQWGDARTNLDTYLQLRLRMDRRDNKADGVLNGPTSEAWFDHWYLHLERMGVEFVHARLDSLEWEETPTDSDLSKIIAKATRLDDGSRETIAGAYIVIATDARTSELVTEPLRADAQPGGTIGKLAGFTTSEPVADKPARLPWEPTSPHTGKAGERCVGSDGDPDGPYGITQFGMKPWDRFQTLSGIQFYFDTEFQLVRGHVYFSNTPWSLSSINQSGLWQDQPFTFGEPDDVGKVRSGFTSVLSVDIGDWRARADEGGPAYTKDSLDHLENHIWGEDALEDIRKEFEASQQQNEEPPKKPAIHCTRDEIAREVWRQMKEALANGADQELPDYYFPEPVWYTLDRNLVTDEKGYLVENKAPYLVPIVNDWENRPGGPPWNPHGHSDGGFMRTLSEEEMAMKAYWEAEHTGYHVHGDRVVFAGTWTKTFTRMTSMEAACESGRHAVNAILDHYIWKNRGRLDGRSNSARLAWQIPLGFLDQGGSSPVRQPTVAGDYCFVYDLENREPSEFRQIRFLDERMLLKTKEHPWSALGLDLIARGLNVPVGELLKFADVSRLIEDAKRWRKLFEALISEPETSKGDQAASSVGGNGGPDAPNTSVERLLETLQYTYEAPTIIDPAFFQQRNLPDLGEFFDLSDKNLNFPFRPPGT